MSRRDEFKKNVNPATKFLEWKSEKKCFEFWNKEAEEKQALQLPIKFLVLKQMHTVKGFEDASQSGISSNEVQYIGKEPLKVYSFKGGEIAEGLWKDIKGKIDSAGGYYVQSIYAMLEETGEIINFQLKGGAVSAWYEFTNRNYNRLAEEWVSIEDAEERKKGAIKYSVPVFKFDHSLSKEEDAKAEKVYNTLKVYMDAYMDAKEITEDKNTVDDFPTPDDFEKPPVLTGGDEDDDLPF